MKKKYNPRKFKIHRSYSTEEVAERLGIHIGTVHQWTKIGLRPIDPNSKPYIYDGRDVIVFIKAKNASLKRPLQPGESFCFRCQKATKSRPEDVVIELTGKKIGKSSKQTNTRGICEVCGCKTNKFVSDKTKATARLLGSTDSPTIINIIKHQNMIKPNIDNERVKRSYLHWLLKGAKGMSAKTVEGIATSIWRWEEFTNGQDFRKFNEDEAVKYKEYLLRKKNQRSGKPISLSTTYHCLRDLYEFFVWLSGQTGYRSKIRPNDIGFLKLSKKETRIALQTSRPKYPTPEMVKKVFESIEDKNEVDKRDKALIAFTFLTGMRVEAITTLSLGCIDMDNMMFIQDPKQGVRTKFSKYIPATLFNFDDDQRKYVIDWIDYLLKVKLFTLQDPLFPANKIEQTSDNNYCFISEQVEAKFWESTSSVRAIFKRRFKEAGVEYFSPHKFRHLAVKLALENCRTGEEIKAVSQNFGHENVRTTMTSYGDMPTEDVNTVIKRMNFDPKIKARKALIKEKINELEEMLDQDEG